MTAHDAWLRRFHAVQEPDIRLACFPYAGGSAGFYFPISQALHPRVEVLAVQYPGRQDRCAEGLIDRIPVLAEHVHAALRPWLDRPLALFGHSMGAMVAYEVAARIERETGGSVAHLFVSGMRAPSRHRDGDPVHARDDDGVIAVLKELSGTDMRALDEELLRLMLPVVRNDYRAFENYSDDHSSIPGRELRCPVTAFTGDADPSVTVDEVSAWAGHTAGEFDMKILAGAHFFLSDRTADVAGVIAGRLVGDRVIATGPSSSSP